jgi:SAM-dependent MidA family methyltransferase
MNREARETSDNSITRLIAAEGGRVTFARFMETALTHPTLGYYSRVDRLLRHGGDFNTAPALSPFFNRMVARLVTELVDAACETVPPGRLCVVELGGGEGHLVEAILRFWEDERPGLRGRVGYRIVEVGGWLRGRQAAALEELVAAGWDVGWGADLEQAAAGVRPVVMVGNEFLDALPVHLVDVAETQAREVYVENVDADLAQSWGELSSVAAAEIELLFGTLDPRRLEVLTDDGILEVRPGFGDLMRRVADLMPSGSLVNIDYGDWFRGVGQAQADCRCGLAECAPRRRTLRGYFRHQLTRDVLARPGRQDLTADVDFAAVDLHGRLAAFETLAFTSLAAFLRGGGAEEELRELRAGAVGATGSVGPLGAAEAAGEAEAADPLEADRQATVLQSLLDEEDLGGAFKVMVQVRE